MRVEGGKRKYVNNVKMCFALEKHDLFFPPVTKNDMYLPCALWETRGYLHRDIKI